MRPRAIAAPPLILFSRGSSDRKSGLRLGRVREPRKLTLSNSLPYSPKLLEIIYKYLITLQEQGWINVRSSCAFASFMLFFELHHLYFA